MTDTIERDRLLAAWEAAKQTLEQAKANEMACRKAVIPVAFPADAKEGTNRVPLANGYHLKYVRKVSYKLNSDVTVVGKVDDAIHDLGNEGPFLAERILKRTYDFGMGEYKKLDISNPTHAAAKKLIDSVLTTSEAAPSLEIETPKEKN